MKQNPPDALGSYHVTFYFGADKASPVLILPASSMDDATKKVRDLLTEHEYDEIKIDNDAKTRRTVFLSRAITGYEVALSPSLPPSSTS